MRLWQRAVFGVVAYGLLPNMACDVWHALNGIPHTPETAKMFARCFSAPYGFTLAYLIGRKTGFII